MSKRVWFIVILMTFLTVIISAQEARQFSLGLGVDGSMNSRKGFALGGSLSLDYGIIQNLCAGIKFGFSHNFDRIMILEPESFVRWYFFSTMKISLFAQADIGASLVFEDLKLHPTVLGGLTMGVRIPLKDWYVEPYVRGGYPVIWGSGIIAGYRF